MLKSILNNQLRNQDLALLVLRIIGGGFMLTHGWPKLMKVIGGDFQFADPIGVGPTLSLILTVFAEFVCAILLLVGFKGRAASIFLMFTMLVAALVIHGGDPWGKKEFPLLYFGIYLAIFLMGTGRYSVDNNIGKS